MKFLVFFKNFIVEISKLKLAKAQFRFRKILAKDPVIVIFWPLLGQKAIRPPPPGYPKNFGSSGWTLS